MRFDPDHASSHEYEIKQVHMDGSTFRAIVFYLRVGEPVDIKVEDVLKITNLWEEPSLSSPKKQYHLIFEVKPEEENGMVDLYISRFDVELNREDKS